MQTADSSGDANLHREGVDDVLLEDSSGLQISQEFDNVLGHGWWSGQMVSGGLESVLIGHPVDGDDNAIGIRVRVASLRNSSNVLGRLAHLFLRSALLHFDAIFSFECEAVGSVDVHVASG